VTKGTRIYLDQSDLSSPTKSSHATEGWSKSRSSLYWSPPQDHPISSLFQVACLQGNLFRWRWSFVREETVGNGLEMKLGLFKIGYKCFWEHKNNLWYGLNRNFLVWPKKKCKSLKGKKQYKLTLNWRRKFDQLQKRSWILLFFFEKKKEEPRNTWHGLKGRISFNGNNRKPRKLNQNCRSMALRRSFLLVTLAFVNQLRRAQPQVNL